MNEKKLATKADLKEFYTRILPYLGGSGGGSLDTINVFDFSNERKIGTWVDGKNLYQKTISFTTPSSSSETDIIFSAFDNVDSAFIDFNSSYIFYETGGSKQYIPFGIPWNNVVGSGLIPKVNVENHILTISFIMGSWWVNKSATMTIRFTKFNDDDSSVIDGIHYSTDEQLIGTWLDGSNLYQKTVSVTLPSTTSETQVQIPSITNISNIFVDFDGSYIQVDDTDYIKYVPLGIAWNGLNGGTPLIPKVNSSNKNCYVNFEVGSSWYGKTALITFRYTKNS